MAKEGDIVYCEIVHINPDGPKLDGWGYRRFCMGDVHCQFMDETIPENLRTMIMVNGSWQNIPVEDRVIGLIGKLRWAQIGGYNGWVWAGRKYE